MSTCAHAPTPDRIMHYAIGAWMCGILAAALRHRVFERLETDAHDAGTVAASASITERGAQALLDGLLGLGLVTLEEGAYRPTPQASRYLVPQRPDYLGEVVELGAEGMAGWAALVEALQTGQPPAGGAALDVGAGMAPLVRAAALAAARRLGLWDAGALRVLDVGGRGDSAGAAWQDEISAPTVTPIDLAALDGLEERFDVVTLMLVSHRLSPEQNQNVLRRIRPLVASGGLLVVGDFMLDDDRTGDAWALAYHAHLMLTTARGAIYRRSDYELWLRDASFSDVLEESLEHVPIRLLYAR